MPLTGAELLAAPVQDSFNTNIQPHASIPRSPLPELLVVQLTEQKREALLKLSHEALKWKAARDLYLSEPTLFDRFRKKNLRNEFDPVTGLNGLKLTRKEVETWDAWVNKHDRPHGDYLIECHDKAYEQHVLQVESQFSELLVAKQLLQNHCMIKSCQIEHELKEFVSQTPRLELERRLKNLQEKQKILLTISNSNSEITQIDDKIKLLIKERDRLVVDPEIKKLEDYGIVLEDSYHAMVPDEEDFESKSRHLEHEMSQTRDKLRSLRALEMRDLWDGPHLFHARILDFDRYRKLEYQIKNLQDEKYQLEQTAIQVARKNLIFAAEKTEDSLRGAVLEIESVFKLLELEEKILALNVSDLDFEIKYQHYVDILTNHDKYSGGYSTLYQSRKNLIDALFLRKKEQKNRFDQNIESIKQYIQKKSNDIKKIPGTWILAVDSEIRRIMSFYQSRLDFFADGSPLERSRVQIDQVLYEYQKALVQELPFARLRVLMNEEKQARENLEQEEYEWIKETQQALETAQALDPHLVKIVERSLKHPYESEHLFSNLRSTLEDAALTHEVREIRRAQVIDYRHSMLTARLIQQKKLSMKDLEHATDAFKSLTRRFLANA